MKNQDRTKDLKELATVFEKYGKDDIRLGQAIYNAMRSQKIDLYTIENDTLLKLLKESLRDEN